MFTGWERPSHWLVLAIVVVALFGYKKLPDAARSIGRSLRVFKTEVKGMADDDKARDSARAADTKPVETNAVETQPAVENKPAVEPAPRADAEGPAPTTDQQPQAGAANP